MAKKKAKHQKDPEHFKIKRTPNKDEHVRSCNSGYTRTTLSRYRQVHHILPISSLSDSTIFKMLNESDDDFAVIRNCLALTEWNINAAGNVISLPIKRAFVDRSPKSWNGYPCHQVDHNPHYTKLVSRHLTQTVWQPHLKAAKECKFDADTLAKALDAASEKWRKFLLKRGASNGGTAYCWENRWKIEEKSLTAPANKDWYYPFSMHPGIPTKKKPPPVWEKFSNNMKGYLSNLLKAL